MVGGVVIISLNLKGNRTFESKKNEIILSGIIAGAALLFIYGGLIASGALFSTEFPNTITRPELLSGLSFATLGMFYYSCGYNYGYGRLF